MSDAGTGSGLWSNLAGQAQALPSMVASSVRQWFVNREPLRATDASRPIVVVAPDAPPLVRYARVLHGLQSPVAFVDPGAGPLLYAVDQTGLVYSYDARRASAALDVQVVPPHGTRYTYRDGQTIVVPPLLDVRRRIGALSPLAEERGLLQMVFHPRDAGRFFLYYTVTPARNRADAVDVVLEEWRLLDPDADSGDEDDTQDDDDDGTSSSEDEDEADSAAFGAKPVRVLLRMGHPQSNHFGSPIGFSSADGLLYVATGDGGGAGDKHGPIGNAQNPVSVWGKILRLDVDAADPRGTLRIVSLGLRNPWRCSFANDGRTMLLGEVGQDKYEGIHADSGGGENHGWRGVENSFPYDAKLLSELLASGVRITAPLMWYRRRLGRAVIGGYELAHGRGYLFGDFTGGGGLDNVYLLRADSPDGDWKREGALWVQPIERAGERARYLHSFARDRRGTLYGAFSNSLGPAGRKGAIYRIDVS
ncbi:Glucose/Sorbosone dehydrogenase [uncultured virus]|nr:Glucose/Sorbosone dehydrogenase [uncultured virus]